VGWHCAPVPLTETSSDVRALEKGGVSLWCIKKQTGILAKFLLPAFQRMATPAEKRILKSPAARLPAPKAAAKPKNGKEAANAPA
jgi:hypothetical protein